MSAIAVDNTYTGNGVTTLYSFTFPYISEDDVKVSLDDVITTEYTFANATQISFDSAPADGVEIRIYRDTNIEAIPNVFYPGSAVRARDLNDNFTQTLYVIQENTDSADKAAASALEAKEAARDAAQSAEESAQSSAAAISTADSAVDIANLASSAAVDANITADRAEDNSEDAQADAQNAVALAEATAQLVADAALPLSVQDIATIPANPSDLDLVEVIDSTGIESFSPLSGLPAGFVGEPGLSVRIVYETDTWNYVSYRANDPDDRYTTYEEAKQAAQAELGAEVTANSDAIAGLGNTVDLAANAMPKSGGAFTGNVEFSNNQATATGVTAGIVTLSSSYELTSGNGAGVAATPTGVKKAYDRASLAYNKADDALSKTDGGTVSGAVTFEDYAYFTRNGYASQYSSGSQIVFGDDADCEMFSDGNHMIIDLNDSIGNLYIRDITTNRFVFSRSGDLTVGGEVTAANFVGGMNPENVKNAIATSSPNQNGTYGLMTANQSTNSEEPGWERAGSGLRYASASGNASPDVIPSGTWRLLGRSTKSGNNTWGENSTSLWVRIA